MATRSAYYRRRGPRAPPVHLGGLEEASQTVGRALRSRWAARIAAIAVPAAVGLTTARRRLGLHPAVALPIACTVPAGAAVALSHSRARYAAIAASCMWLFKVSWEMPIDDREKLRRRLRIDYPIRFDSLVGFGVPPGLRLQRALHERGHTSRFDQAVALVYGSWFLPHALLAYVLLRHKEFVPRAGARLAASYYLTVPFYWVVPTAPPWWASEHGRMGGELDRVLRRVVFEALRRPVPEQDNTPGNPWGSMPSDHISSAAITAMGLAEVGPLYGALGWAYVGAASFAVVYLGEHYVIDVIAGLAVADAVRRAEPHVAPFARAVARATR